jgi:AcrR family transcriptional regulator
MSDSNKLTHRQLQAIETRNRLFVAAHELLKKKDYDSITIKEIVKRVGTSIGSFYLYFKSKLDEYYQTYEKPTNRYFDEFVAKSLDEGNAKDQIPSFFRHSFNG